MGNRYVLPMRTYVPQQAPRRNPALEARLARSAVADEQFALEHPTPDLAGILSSGVFNPKTAAEAVLLAFALITASGLLAGFIKTIPIAKADTQDLPDFYVKSTKLQKNPDPAINSPEINVLHQGEDAQIVIEYGFTSAKNNYAALSIQVDNNELYHVVEGGGERGGFRYWWPLATSNLSLGNHTAKAILDPHNEVNESDETNNERILKFSVIEPRNTPEPLPEPDWTEKIIEKLRKFFPTRIPDSNEKYKLAEMRGDDNDISNNHENYDENPRQFLVDGKQPVYASVTPYPNDKTVFTYGFYRSENDFYGFDNHEHDAEYAWVLVNESSGQPEKLALSWHLFPPRVYDVSAVRDLEYYVELHGGGGGKQKWEVITNGAGEKTTGNDVVFIPLVKTLSTNASIDVGPDGNYRTDEPSVVKVPAMHSDSRVLDPLANVFKTVSDYIKSGFVYFKLGSPADISVELGGKTTSKDLAEIVESGYNNKEVVILGVDESDSPEIKITGTGNGTIHLYGRLATNQPYEFSTTAPIKKDAVYAYTPNWQAIADKKPNSFTVRIDANGDGYFEKEKSGKVLPEDIGLKQAHAGVDVQLRPYALLATGIAAISGVMAGIYYSLTRRSKAPEVKVRQRKAKRKL